MSLFKRGSALITRIQERGISAVPNKAPTLHEYSSRFLNWVNNTHQLNSNTQKYYASDGNS